jgi:hypothetical protein
MLLCPLAAFDLPYWLPSLSLLLDRAYRTGFCRTGGGWRWVASSSRGRRLNQGSP